MIGTAMSYHLYAIPKNSSHPISKIARSPLDSLLKPCGNQPFYTTFLDGDGNIITPCDIKESPNQDSFSEFISNDKIQVTMINNDIRKTSSSSVSSSILTWAASRLGKKSRSNSSSPSATSTCPNSIPFRYDLAATSVNIIAEWSCFSSPFMNFSKTSHSQIIAATVLKTRDGPQVVVLLNNGSVNIFWLPNLDPFDVGNINPQIKEMIRDGAYTRVCFDSEGDHLLVWKSDHDIRIISLLALDDTRSKFKLYQILNQNEWWKHCGISVITSNTIKSGTIYLPVCLFLNIIFSNACHLADSQFADGKKAGNNNIVAEAKLVCLFD